MPVSMKLIDRATLASTVASVGDGAVFNCITNSAMALKWLVNGTSLSNLELSNVVETFVNSRLGILQFSNVSLEYNNTRIQCLVNTSSGVIASGNSTLFVQGNNQLAFMYVARYAMCAMVVWQAWHCVSCTQVSLLLLRILMWLFMVPFSPSPGQLHSHWISLQTQILKAIVWRWSTPPPQIHYTHSVGSLGLTSFTLYLLGVGVMYSPSLWFQLMWLGMEPQKAFVTLWLSHVAWDILCYSWLHALPYYFSSWGDCCVLVPKHWWYFLFYKYGMVLLYSLLILPLTNSICTVCSSLPC